MEGSLGYLLLALTTLLSSIFGLVVKSAHHTGRNPIAVGGLNYVAAALLGGVFLFLDTEWEWDHLTILLGIATGVFYVVAFWFVARSVVQGGVAITMAIVRLSVVAPIACSIFIWNEIPSGLQTAGIVLVCLALPFLSVGTGDGQPAVRLRNTLWFIGALFVTTGFCSLSPKVFSELSTERQMPLYVFSLFATSALVSLVFFRIKRIPILRRDYAHGFVQGACNILSAVTMVMTLKHLPGTLVFPVTSASGLILTTAAAILIWKEQLRGRVYIGIGLTVIALVLVNGD